jgi:hypothetical protein
MAASADAGPVPRAAAQIGFVDDAPPREVLIRLASDFMRLSSAAAIMFSVRRRQGHVHRR